MSMSRMKVIENSTGRLARQNFSREIRRLKHPGTCIYGSPSRKKAWRARLLYSGREKQYKSYYPLRRRRCGKIWSPRLEGARIPRCPSASFPRRAPLKRKGMETEFYPAMTPLMSVNDIPLASSHWFHQYVCTRTCECARACHLSSRTIPHIPVVTRGGNV